MARGRLRAIAAGVANVLGLPTPVREQWVSLVDLIAGESVSYIDTAAGYTFDRTFSAINGTGVPVQFSVAIGEGTRVARVLGEAGRPGHSMHERLELGGRQAVALMELLNSRSALPAIDRVLALLLPPGSKRALRAPAKRFG